MYGKNPIRPPENGPGLNLAVQEIFPTLQGEGPFAGMPAVFVRLGGCNLACSFCDTEFEDFDEMSLRDIIGEVESLAKSSVNAKARKLVVITGGEPLRQPIELLCQTLLDDGFDVQIETNGTIWRELPKAVDVVCSPKATNGTYFPVRDDVLQRASALKFIVSEHLAGYGDVPEVGQDKFDTPVYVQPMDEYDEIKNQENLMLATRLAMQNGYRLSVQLHKIIGVA